jgi:glycosyltransferase involved in cell wall biosynthesis
MRHFSRRNTALYINSIVMQKPNLSEGGRFFGRLFRKTKSMMTGLKKSDAGFWVYSPITLPVHHLAWARPLNKKILEYQVRLIVRRLGMDNPIVLAACPAACDVALDMKKTRLIYQRTDRFEEYPDVDAETIRQYDRKLKANADLTIFVSNTLYNEESTQCKKAIYLDHGVDFELFASAEQDSHQPPDITRIPRPIVGFFGKIDDYTVDIGFAEKVIDYLPDKSFVFIGRVDTDCSRLAAKENVWILGKKPYEQIPHYGKHFDVAIMPWRQNRWIDACNPIKLKEYLALGKPVVSTPFGELQKYLDVIYEAGTPEQFAKSIERAMTENSPERAAARKEKVEKATWHCKAQFVLEELFEHEQMTLK